MKYIFLISLLLGIYVHGYGQSKSKAYIEDETFSVRFNILGLADFIDQNVSFGGEYRFNTNWAAGTDLAYIFNSNYIQNIEQTSGLILRPFVKFYPDNFRDTYFEANLHYKNANYKLMDWLDKDVENGVPAYQEYTAFTYNKRVIGLDVKIGYITDLSANGRLKMDIYGGIGYRYKKQGVNDGVYTIQRRSLWVIEEPESSTLSLPLGVRLRYLFK